MEFEDDDHDHDHDHEEEEEEEDEDEEEGITIPPPRLHPLPRTSAVAFVGGSRYRECQKNHAVSIGGHAVDGCGEFMPAAEDALKCAACNCHRNFHRKESETETNPAGSSNAALYQQQLPHPPLPYFRSTPAPAYLHRPLALPSTAQEMEELSNPSSSGGGGKKRFRTKFTAEQKERMIGFAERIGWRITKQDEAAVDQFCSELNLSRQVLKVWLHNNKHTLGRKLP